MLLSPQHLKDNQGILWTTLCYRIGDLDEIDQLSKGHNLPKLTQREIDNLNKPMTIKGNVKKKATGQAGFTGGFYQTLKEEMILILYNSY